MMSHSAALGGFAAGVLFAGVLVVGVIAYWRWTTRRNRPTIGL